MVVGALDSCFCCPDGFPAVHLVACGRPVCTIGAAVSHEQGKLLWLTALI